MTSSTRCKQCGKTLTPIGICPVCSVRIVRPSTRKPGQFGQYELEESTARRGGMGVVYKAYSPRTQRHVAVKLLKNDILLSPEASDRFRNEVRALAALSHPGILPIYEAGNVEGQPFFAMRWVEGGSLAERMAEFSLDRKSSSRTSDRTATNRRIAKLIADVASAVHHAHQKGILHRDLKPGNILIDEEGHAYVADFGIAKFLDNEQAPAMTQCDIGSPPYMPPEPAKSASPAWDIWSLGVILYELLTGQLPFQAEDKSTLAAQIRDGEPEKPRRIAPGVSRELETICLKCLRKEPARRYAGARDLADDLMRFVRDEPILARDTGLLERGWYRCRRKPVQSIAMAGLLIAVLLLVVFWIQTREQRQLASMASLRKGIELLEQNQTTDGLAWLAKSLREDPENSIAATRAANTMQQKHFLTRRTSPLRHDRRITALAFSPDGSALAAGTAGVEARLWNAKTGEAISPSLSHNRAVNSLAFSSDGQWLATCSADHTARIWDIRNPRAPSLSLDHMDWVVGACFLDRDRELATVSLDGSVQTWDIESRKLVHAPVLLNGPVSAVSFTPDVGRILISSSSGSIEACRPDASSRRVVGADENAPVLTTFDSGGKRAAKVFEDGAIRIFDADSGRLLYTLKHVGAVQAAFGPKLDRIATGSADGSIHLHDLRTGRTITNTSPTRHSISALIFSRSSVLLVAGSDNGLIRVLNSETGLEAAEPISQTSGVCALEIDHEDAALAVGCEDGSAVIWEIHHPSAPTVQRFDSPVTVLAIHPGGHEMVAGADDGSARIINTATGAALAELIPHEQPVMDAAYSSEGHWLAIASFDGRVRVYPTGNGKPYELSRVILLEHPREVRKAVFDPAMPVLATASYDGGVRLWEMESGQSTTHPRLVLQHDDKVRALAFSRDGRMLATGADDAKARIWNPDTGELLATFIHGATVREIAFSPEGRRLATASDDKSVRLWNLDGRGSLLREFHHDGPVMHVSFSLDGHLLASASQDATARIWNLTTGREQSAVKHDRDLLRVEFNRTATCFITASADGTARVWDTTTGLPLTEPFQHSGDVMHARFGSNDLSVATVSADGTARIWSMMFQSPQPPSSGWPAHIERFVQKKVDGAGRVQAILHDDF